MTKKEFYKTIFSFFKKRKKQIFCFFLFMVGNLVFGFIFPYLEAKFLRAITLISLEDILKISLLLLGLRLLEQIFSFIRGESEYKLENQITLDTQTFILQELFLLEQKNFDTMGTSFFSSRFSRDTQSIPSFFFQITSNMSWTLKSFGVLLYLFSMSFWIGGYIVIGSLLVFLFRLRILKMRKKQREKEDAKGEKYHSSFAEIIRGIRDIKVLHLKEVMINKTVSERISLQEMERENRKKSFLMDEVRWGLEEVIDVGVYILAIYLITKNLFLGANLLILHTYKGQAFGFIENLFRFFENVERVQYSFSRLYELCDGKTYSKEKYGTKNLPILQGDIRFKNVSFAYGDTPVLQQVSFHIKPNDTVGFVGKSGAGKSTIFQLLTKLYTKKEGDILLDGVSIEELDEKTIRENISVITQNPYLFNMTIRENLKIVRPLATEEEMIESAKLCSFHDYVMQLPDGYDTYIGEGGVILSGGQRQRLALARALLKKSEIILLDEATSALDNETQDFIKKSIQQISKNYTILIIAHRLSTIKDCDYIFVVEEGKIVGKGTHEELKKKNKIYQKLYKYEVE